MRSLFSQASRDSEPLDLLVEHEERAMLSAGLASLTEKDRRVLSLRFGIDGKRVHTVAQVANACKLPPAHAETVIETSLNRLLAAMLAAKNGLPTNNEIPSADTSKTPIESHSPKTSHTDHSAKKNGKNGGGSPKTG
jgi:uncharacterized protein YpbB